MIGKPKAYAEIIIALLGFAFLTAITTYPLIWHMGNGIYGFPGDSLSTIWVYWRNYQGFLTDNFPPLYCNLVGAPFGGPEAPGMLDPHFYEGLLLTILTNEVIAYNLMVMLGILASAFMAYLLSRSLWQSQWGSIVSGVVFGFCPMLAMTAGGHMGFTHLQWIALYILSLFYFKKKGILLSAILCGIALGIVVVTNFYIGYISIVATVVFLLCWIHLEGHWRLASLSWKRLGLFFAAVLVGGVLSLPWTWPILRLFLFGDVSGSPIADMAHRPIGSLYYHAARPWDYFLPPIDHPVFGNHIQAIYNSIKGWKLGVSYGPWITSDWFSRFGNWWGQVYLGWTPLALATYGLITGVRREKGLIPVRERFALIFFGVLFAVSVWFAMPPEFPVGEIGRKVWPSFPDWRLPTPSYFLYHLLPMFRRYAVFGIATILSVAVLAGFGMRELLLRRENRCKRAGAILLFFGLIFFEFLHGPRHTRFPPVPQEYEWLANQTGDIIIAEYPIYYRYSLFFQRVHGKRMVNWNAGWTFVEKSIWPKIEDLTKKGSVERLGALGVQYVFLHTTDYFGLNPLDSLQSMGYTKPLKGAVNGLELVKETATGQVFKVTEKSALMMVYPDPKSAVKKPWVSNSIWRWELPKQRIYIFSGEHKPVKVDLSATAAQCKGEFRVLGKEEKLDKVGQLQWYNGRVCIPDVICAADAETVIEVSLQSENVGRDTVWSELSVDIVAMSDAATKGTSTPN